MHAKVNEICLETDGFTIYDKTRNGAANDLVIVVMESHGSPIIQYKVAPKIISVLMDKKYGLELNVDYKDSFGKTPEDFAISLQDIFNDLVPKPQKRSAATNSRRKCTLL